MTRYVLQSKVNRKRLCYQRDILRIAVLGLTIMFSFWAGVQASADDIQWLDISVPEYGKDRFDINEVKSIRTFAMDDDGKDANYDVTLIDKEGRMVRIDVASNKYWEFTPRKVDKREPRTQRLFFKRQVSEQNEQYRGRIYFPYGDSSIPVKHQGGIINPSYVVPYPTKNGFRGVIMDWSDVHRFSLFQFTANRELGDIKVKKIDPERVVIDSISMEFPMRSEFCLTNGQFLTYTTLQKYVMTDRYYLANVISGSRLIACLRWDGEKSFLMRGPTWDDLHPRWDRLACAPLSNSNAIVIVYEEGLVHYDGQKRQMAYPDGWSPQLRKDETSFSSRNSLQFQNDGSRVQIIMKGPDRQFELWTFDCKTLEVLEKLPLPSADYGASFQEKSGLLVVQTYQEKNANLLLFDRQSGRELPKLIGKTSPLTASVGRAGCWTLSDDGNMIFFVSRPDANKNELKLGHVSVRSLQFQELKAKPVVGSGFDAFSQDEMSFEDLPTNATDAVVGILPEAKCWWTISPNDRWLVGSGCLYDTLSRKPYFLPLGYASSHAFSADSKLLATFTHNQVQVWDVSGDKPFIVASSDRLPKAVRKELSSILSGTDKGACFVTEDSVGTTNRHGSVRFRINSPNLEVVHKTDELKAWYTAYSDNGSNLAIWKDDGSMWMYKWTGQTWKGVAKVKPPFFNRRTHKYTGFGFHAMSANGDCLAICNSSGLTMWRDLQHSEQQPLFRKAPMDWAAISQNQQWIIYVQNTNDGCDLTLVDSKLNKVATHRLPFQFKKYNVGLVVTNDGKHAMVRNDSGRYYVIRLQSK